ncbi:hypothetical protein SAMN02910344_01221 [Ruminobacter amylophilus]|uniref:Uncharacterized protein n=1 Tax=Ruminobacter amylophilus TaxID=867 RepID=A0A662ZIR0_9GAMM|nr:hypothetical protein [Ruminobacter amylophilus]SFP37359.1 hypothetical protein SAMN02910344_01221 [Ruminobacter amylophilus]
MKKRKIEDFMRCGAKMRVLKSLFVGTMVDAYPLLSPNDRAKMRSMEGKLREICSRLEGCMFRNVPGLSDDYLDVFYGAPDISNRSPVDAKVVEMAKEMVDEMFGKAD